MTKMVTVARLTLEQHRKFHGNEIREYGLFSMTPIMGEPDGAIADVNAEVRIYPIHRFCEHSKPDRYIAYTPELQEYLSMPFDAMKTSMEAAQNESARAWDRIEAFKSMPLWRRLVAAWRGRW